MLLRVDELNALRGDLERYKGDKGKMRELLDDWLLLAYADGKTDVEDQLRGESKASVDRIRDVMYAKVGGKTVLERLEEDKELDDIEDLYLLFANERNRVYNTAANDTAKTLEAKYKTWNTMKDPRVRDTHDYLEGMTKPMNEPFYTYTGDSAQHPGAFGVAEQDINCRCWLTYTK